MSASSTAFCASMKTTSPYALKAILFCRLDASTTVWPTISASNIAALRPRALPALTTATICGGGAACQRNPVAAQRVRGAGAVAGGARLRQLQHRRAGHHGVAQHFGRQRGQCGGVATRGGAHSCTASAAAAAAAAAAIFAGTEEAARDTGAGVGAAVGGAAFFTARACVRVD